MKPCKTLNFATFFSLLFFFNTRLIAQTNVLTQHNDLKRTGWNNTETILDQGNVNNNHFGKIFSRQVDDQIYAQPLVVSNLSIGGGTHNVVYVATVNNSVYAFDADDSATNSPYWQVNLTYDSAGYRPPTNLDLAVQGACNGIYSDFSGNMGTVGTPVIDLASKTLYVVVKSVMVNNGDSNFVQYLHALDITTGAEKSNSPVKILPTIQRPNNGGLITFNAKTQNQRPGLLLYNNVVYVSWASHCDLIKYYGWVIGYDATSLAQVFTYNDTPTGGAGGIWMSGQAPAVDDSGNIYITTGNGQVGTPNGSNPNDTINRGESLVKLSTTSGQLQVTDFFTPFDYAFLNTKDLDFGSDGVLLIPNTSLSLSGSKEGILYLINDTAMGGYTPDNSNVLQTLSVNGSGTSFYRDLHGSPVYFKDNNNNEYVYAWASSTSTSTGFLKQYPFNRNTMRFDTLNTIIGNTQLPVGKPGGMLSLSSNGSQSGTGILWASHPTNGNANNATVPGELQAFDAIDVTHELWNSNWNAKRDSIGTFAKFVNPTIANGKVYMATFSNALNVYGLNPPQASPCSNTLDAGWGSADIGYTKYAGDVCNNNGTYTITASGADINGNTDAFHYYYEPAITGYFEVKVRIDSIASTDSSAKCGIMYRSNLDFGSPNVFIGLTSKKGIVVQSRTTQNGTTSSITSPGIKAPYWLGVMNYGNMYVFYASPDGNANTWTSIDTIFVALGSHPYVGIAYTARNNYVLGKAVFDSLSAAPQTILSTDITKFTAKNIKNKYAELSWATQNDTGVDHFEIERSTSTSDFDKIGSQISKQVVGTNTYTFNDLNPSNGLNYYRIKEVSKTGQIKYSTTVQVLFNLTALTIYPNPASIQLFIKNNSDFTNNQNINVSLADVSGRIIARKEFSTDGINIIVFDISRRISEGMYVLWVTNSKGEKQGQKVYIKH